MSTIRPFRTTITTPGAPTTRSRASVTVLPTPRVLDDERRQPMGLAERDTCARCQGPVLRTDSSGLCWSCMPTGRAAA